jgi:hypothetical protein
MRTTFTQLSPAERRRFISTHYGFLEKVRLDLAARGIRKAQTTLSRTWHGQFRAPDPEVVAALEAAYLANTRTPQRRPGAVRRIGTGVATAAAGELARPRHPLTPPDIVPSLLAGGHEHLHPARGRESGSPTDTNRRTIHGLRTMQAKEDRQAWLRERMRQRRADEEEAAHNREAIRNTPLTEVYITVAEGAEILSISSESMRKIASCEPGVLALGLGRNKMRRIPMSVLERIIRRATVPPPRA